MPAMFQWTNSVSHKSKHDSINHDVSSSAEELAQPPQGTSQRQCLSRAWLLDCGARAAGRHLAPYPTSARHSLAVTSYRADIWSLVSSPHTSILGAPPDPSLVDCCPCLSPWRRGAALSFQGESPSISASSSVCIPGPRTLPLVCLAGSSVNGLEEPSIAKRLRGTPERIELENYRLSVRQAEGLEEVPEETQAEHNLSSVLDTGTEEDAASRSASADVEPAGEPGC